MRRRQPTEAAPLLERGEDPVHEEGQGEQDERERDRHVEVPLAGLEHGGGRQHPRLSPDVAADHQRGAHLRDDGAEGRHQGGQEREPRLPDEHPEELDARGAEGLHLEAEAVRDLLDGRQRQADHQRDREEELGKDDGRGRVEELEATQGPAAPEQDRDEETDDDGRQPHPRVHQRDDEPPAGKAGERQQGPERDADQEREDGRRTGQPQRQPRDPQDFRVAAPDQLRRADQPVPDQRHPGGLAISGRVRRAITAGPGAPGAARPLSADLLLPLAGDRHEQRLPVLVDPEGLDDRLHGGRQHEVGEGLSRRRR